MINPAGLLINGVRLVTWIVRAVGVFAINAWRAARGWAMPDADNVLAEDARAPVLYLRSFTVDSESRFWSWRPVLEHMVARDLWSVGPVIAIAEPDQKPRRLGAARLYCSPDEWQARVQKLITDAAGVVFVCENPTDGFRWETQRVVDLCEPTQLLGIVTGAGRMDPYAHWSLALGSTFPQGVPDRADLPSKTSAPGLPRAWLTFDKQWKPIVSQVNLVGRQKLDPAPSSILAPYNEGA